MERPSGAAKGAGRGWEERERSSLARGELVSVDYSRFTARQDCAGKAVRKLGYEGSGGAQSPSQPLGVANEATS